MQQIDRCTSAVVSVVRIYLHATQGSVSFILRHFYQDKNLKNCAADVEGH